MIRCMCSVFLFFWVTGLIEVHAGEDYLAQGFNQEYSHIPQACDDRIESYGLGGGAGSFNYLHVMESPPLYFCSGLIIRGTRQNLPAGQNAWDPYPAGRTADTSFSYVRSDIKMTRLAWSYTNGFIIAAPVMLQVSCFYPLDGESDSREEKGCGAHRDKPAAALDCKDNVELSETTPAASRCRFDLRRDDATRQFAKGVKLAAQVSRNSDVPNDLKIETWNAGCDKRLVIRAFFYVNEEGKPFAERDRNKYAQVCGTKVPLVFMQMPGSKEGVIGFTAVD